MGNSAFNKGQSGDASEVGAGVAKIATQVQIDNKVGFDGGVPLFATPDRLPDPTEIGVFNAYEDLAQGDVVGLSHFYPSQVNNVYDNTGNGDSDQALSVADDTLARTWASKAGTAIDPISAGATMYYAQKFYAPSGLTGVGTLLKLNSIGAYYTSPNVFVGDLSGIWIREDDGGQPGDTIIGGTVSGGEGTKLGATIDVSSVDLVPGQAYWFVYRKSGGSSGGNFPYAQTPDGTQWIEQTTPTAIGASDTNVFLKSGDDFATAGTDLGAGTQQLEMYLNYYALPTTGTSVVQKFQVPSERDSVLWGRAENIRVQVNQDTANQLQAFILDSDTPGMGTVVGVGTKNAGTGLTTLTACSQTQARQLDLDTDYYIHVIQEVAGTASVRKDSTDTDPLTDQDVSYTSTDGGNTLTELTAQNYIMQLDATVNIALGHFEVFKASAATVNSNRFAFFGYAKEAATAGNPIKVSRGRYTGIHTGLIAGRKYFLSDTNGELSLTPGTTRIELGYAMSATEMYRDRNQSDWFNFGNDYLIQFDGMCGQDDAASASSYIDIFPRPDVDNGEFIFTGSTRLQSEGGAQGALFSVGQRITGNRTFRACMIYPQS